jgi:hypothetical protein
MELRPFTRSIAGGALTQLLLDPRLEVVAAVQDTAAEAKAARAGAPVPPVPKRGDGGAQQQGGFGDGEQLGRGLGGVIRAGVWSVMAVSEGWRVGVAVNL